MSRLGSKAVLLAGALLVACGPPPQGAAAPGDTTLVAQGPTLIAVVPHHPDYVDSVTSAPDAGTSELAGALDDFAYHLGTADSTLAARGVTVRFHFGPVLAYRTGPAHDSLVFTPDSGVAYVFLSATTRHVRRGVLTHLDLVRIADSVFAFPRTP